MHMHPQHKPLGVEAELMTPMAMMMMVVVKKGREISLLPVKTGRFVPAGRSVL